MKTIPEIRNSDLAGSAFLFVFLVIGFGAASYLIVRAAGFDLTGQILVAIISASTNLTFIFFVLLQFLQQGQTLEAQSELIKAQKAQYAPNLDYKINHESEDSLCELSLRNNGSGTARNIEVNTEFVHNGILLLRHITHLQPELNPDESAILDSEGGKLAVTPDEEALNQIKKIAEKSSSSRNTIKVEMHINYKDILQNDEFQDTVFEQRTLDEDSLFQTKTLLEDYVSLDENFRSRMKSLISKKLLEIEVSLLESIFRDTNSREITSRTDFITQSLSKNEFREMK